MKEKDEKEKTEEQELEKLKEKILSAKNDNELVKVMQEYNLWMQETANRNIKTRPIKNDFNYDVSEQRRKHAINFNNPEAKLKTHKERIGYTTEESRIQDKIRKARKMGLTSKDIEFLKKMGLERLLDES